jgi:hypothetical protein
LGNCGIDGCPNTGLSIPLILAVVGGICGVALTLLYRRYLGILGADRRKPAERQAYDALQDSLAKGNIAARLYAERLTRFLDWIDRSFGDAGMADRTLLPHAFGLRTPAPLWTAPAFDRCLLLALVYPVATIFVIWAISGHVGPAEAAIIAALALAMVVGVQAFDALAAHGGGKPVLPLDALFNGVAAQPTAPEYWWLYALLLSTMIPSLVNLVIGGTSLLRGLPGLPSLLLRKIPTYANVPKFDRAWIATVLTAQVAAGAALGIAAQVFLIWVIIGYVMPFFGPEMLGMACDVAAFNVPVRVGHLLGVSL